MLGDDSPFGQIPPLHLPMPQPGIRRIDQDRLRRLPVPHLPPRIPGISQDRRDRPQRPPGTGPVQVTSWVGRGRARHPGIGELDLNFEAMELPSEPDLRLNLCTADPDTPAADGLKLLASWAATRAVDNTGTRDAHGIR